MKFGLLVSVLFFLFVPSGYCSTKVPKLIEQLDTLFARHQFDSLISLGELVLERAEEEFGPEDTVIAEILIRIVRGYQVGQKGYAKAERYLTRALLIAENNLGHDHKKVAAIMNNMAINCWLTGRFERAREIYEESLKILQATGNEDTREMAAVTNNLAALCHTVGDYARAEELYLMSLPIRAKVFGSEHIEVGKCYNNLGTLYYNLRLYEKAKKYLDISLEKKKKAMGNNNPDVASALLNLATLYRDLEEYEITEDYLTEALKIYKQEYGETHAYTLTVAYNLALLRTDQEKYRVSDSIYTYLTVELPVFMGKEHPLLGMVYYSWAELKELQGLNDESMRLTKKGLKVLESIYGQKHYRVAEIKENLMRLQCRDCNWQKAENNSADACEIRNQLLNRNINILSQSEALESSWYSKRSLDYYLSCLFHDGRIEPFDTLRALNVIVNSKGQVADCIFRRVDKLGQEQDTTTQRIYTELGNLKFTMSNLLSRKPDGDMISLKEYLVELETQINAKEKELAENSPIFRLEMDFYTCNIDKITAKIPDNSIIIDYIYYKQFDFNKNESTDRYLALIIDKNKAPIIIELGKASVIDRQIKRFRDHMLRIAEVGSVDDVIDMAEYRKISGELWSSIWAPVSDKILNVDNVLISPDGALNLLPFGALLIDDNTYLIERYTIHYIPSSRDILRYSGAEDINGGLLAVGAPDFDVDLMAVNPPALENNVKSKQNVSDVRGIGEKNCGLMNEEKYGLLPGAQKEVQAIAVKWRREFPESLVVLTGIEATEEKFIANSKGKRIIHIATHGFWMDSECFDSMYLAQEGDLGNAIIENPLLFSGILFAGANNRNKIPSLFSSRDGVITANDITTLNLNGVSIVVLSVCESGLGQVVNSEGVYGLRRAFMEAGAQCVVSTLWPIVDDRAYMVIHTLYSQADGSVAGKLQEAQVNIIKSNREQNKCNHPFYWAAFIAYGRWIE